MLKDYKKIYTGKVREIYFNENKPNELLLLSSDKVSAFDRANLATIPFKGQVLNQISEYFFNETKDICPNHFINSPSPNSSIVKKAKMFPVEIIVRRYLTGSSKTSIWTNYEKGVRKFCGIDLEENLERNYRFEKAIITPTTKPETGPDENISYEEIIEHNLVPKEKLDIIYNYAEKLFKKGEEIADEKGLIFVDTKYEFGEDVDGNIIVCDEINTPDSSRYWVKGEFSKNGEPKSLDKEFLRLELKKMGFNGEGEIPEISEEFIKKVSENYISLFEKITGKKF